MKVRLRVQVARWVHSASFPSEATATWIALAILLAVFVVLWLLPLPSSFWTDETGTMWAVRGTFDEMIARLPRVPGQPSTLFLVVTWLAARAGALAGLPMEVAVRLPSIMASVVAAVGVYRLARRFTDRLPALVAVGTFATYHTIIFAAADARPYAIPMAAVVWAMFLLFRWCDTGQVGYGIGYAVLTAASIQLHFTCALLLPVHLYHVICGARAVRPARAQVGMVLATLALFLAPLASQLLTLWGERAAHSFTGSPGTRDLVDAIIDVRVIVAFVAIAWVARALYPAFGWEPSVVSTRPYRVLFLWFLVPKVALYVLSLTTDAKVFVSRYYIWAAPALALLTAALLSTIVPPKIRRVAALVLLVVFSWRTVRTGPAAHGGQDWRGALHRAQQAMDGTSSALLVHVGYTESRSGPSTQPSTIEDPMIAPLAVYPVTGDVFLLPTAIDAATTERLERLANERLLTRQSIILLAGSTQSSTELWWRGRLGAAGYTAQTLGDYQGMSLLIWRRPGG